MTQTGQKTETVRINRILKNLAERKVVGKVKDELGRAKFPSLTAVVNQAVEDFLKKVAKEVAA